MGLEEGGMVSEVFDVGSEGGGMCLEGSGTY